MTTSNEEKVSSEDRKILVSLLKDSSEKLVNLCDQIRTFNRQYRFLLGSRYERQDLQLLELDAEILAKKLVKVINIASQVEDHFLVNSIHRLELDLSLADAEAALRRYQVVVGKSPYININAPLLNPKDAAANSPQPD